MNAPATFNIRNTGKTLVRRTWGTKIVSDGLKGRLVDMSLANVQNHDAAFRKLKLITEDVQGKNSLPFLAQILSMTICAPWSKNRRSRLKLMLVSRLLTFTSHVVLVLLKKKNHNSQIQKDLLPSAPAGLPSPDDEIMTQEVQENDLKEEVNEFLPDSIREDIEKACLIHSVMSVLKSENADWRENAFLSLSWENSWSLVEKAAVVEKATGDKTSVKAEKADGCEPPVQESV